MEQGYFIGCYSGLIRIYRNTKQAQGWQRNIRFSLLLGLIYLGGGLTGCGGDATPTRTPFPTWTPTPLGGVTQANPTIAAPVTLPPADPPTPPPPPPTAVPTPEPPTATQAPPTETPTDTPTPEPSPTQQFTFLLEAAEKFPTDSLAPNVVRIYLYVYSPDTLGLEGYSLSVLHNGTILPVDEVSTAGVPEQTRPDPSPYTRFTNMSVIFVEPQVGRWELQLIDANRNPVGPSAPFDLTADEITRELYLRYKLQ